MPSQNLSEYYFIDEELSENITSYNDAGGLAYDAFTKDTEDALKDFVKKYESKFATEPSVLQRAFSLGDSASLKTYEFVRRNPDLYISFWVFSSRMVRTALVSPDTLLKIYNKAYSDKYKGYKAAKHLEALIENKIAVRSNKNFPEFSVVDIGNNKIESRKLRGKYVLIQFWASWCTPCIQEMPDLKELNKKYKGQEFLLISFSIDKDSSAFRKALQNYSMDWAQVFGDNRLYDSLAYIPIPQVYLIDKSGRTIYNSTSIADNDRSVLKKLLAEHLQR
jgi:thiol-disulfide isomerase/thioredoxin